MLLSHTRSHPCLISLVPQRKSGTQRTDRAVDTREFFFIEFASVLPPKILYQTNVQLTPQDVQGKPQKNPEGRSTPSCHVQTEFGKFPVLGYRV